MSGNVSHGNTPAAWTGTILMIVGAVIIAVGLARASSSIWIAGVVLCVAGLVAWIAMNMMGRGQHRH